ncbi:malto-oligosyltrehalose trehalohydrolase [Devosia sp. PTR5]|uniref:Malto-oligosyltrehalose trehalohydrolase n=1 Tax=Devosia oryzisoli TaxID=2774138 RepID=A0A927ISV2_9HYPH|nr:malto-oligosyltrehalose trehalohydrolase [Devosia oryzisoli]MBD8065207.1 malto-oligosyltrehalose trehalohydrolase [Devosia oryzisoli]
MDFGWGALSDGAAGWTFSAWSPDAEKIEIELEGQRRALDRTDGGWWQLRFDAEAGSRYRLVVDGNVMVDPASRLQAGDVHGPSVLHDHASYQWTSPWHGRPWEEAVIYELHIGTFTPEGTFAAAADKLGELARLGITAIEVMPVGQWSGERGWGYDGVLPFAPHPAYGSPDDFKRFVERAQALGMMVVLDLVMNHFGPDGAYIHAASPHFFNPERHTPWGASIDFSQPAVQAFWIQCASMWLTHYRLDGLRLDAIHEVSGPGADEFIDRFSRTLRALPLGRPIHLIAEDERNEPQQREAGYYEANWNDDFHHAIHAELTGESHHYYVSYSVNPIDDLRLALERGQIEEGQHREGRKKARGKPSGHLEPTAFVNAVQTHDQVGNRAYGDRLITIAPTHGVEVAFGLLLAAPFIPMIFMGEERGETNPFLYFADFHDELGRLVREGRSAEFEEIDKHGEEVPDPIARETFEASKLGWKTDERARHWLDLTQRCLHFRHQHIVPLLKSKRVGSAQARQLGHKGIEVQWHFVDGTVDLVLNFGEVAQGARHLKAPQLTINDIARDNYALAIEVHPK